MSTVYAVGVARVALVSMAFIIIFFTSTPVEALNTNSIDLESENGQSLIVSDTNQNGLDLSNNLTIEAWIKFESTHATEASPFIFKRNATGNQRSYAFFANAFTNQLNFDSQYDGSAAGCSVNVAWTPVNGTWYHVAVTKSGTDVHFYVNGSQQGTTQTCSNPAIYNGSADFEIGSWAAGAPSYHDGLIDDVRVWNVARSAAEINDNKSVELAGNEPGLVGYWKLNNSLEDLTANNNDLTNHNGATFSLDAAFDDSPAPPPVTPVLSARKSSNESVTKSTTLQKDDDLQLVLKANTTYVVSGILLTSVPNNSPDIKIRFAGPTGATGKIGYLSAKSASILRLNETSSRIQLHNGLTPIVIKGVVTTDASGNLTLEWAQALSKNQATTMLKGSYLRAEEK